MSAKTKRCGACDRITSHWGYTPAGVGPFCEECWASLVDPDQQLLLEDRLQQSENQIEKLVSEIRRLRTYLAWSIMPAAVGEGGQQ
jgi:hypothetical protein